MTAVERLSTTKALMIEFGISSPSTIPSLRVARNLLSSSVRINILDYVYLRKDGVKALQKAIHPDVKSLREDVRKRRVPLDLVKAMGLRDLLITI